jgi:hypothetical protein
MRPKSTACQTVPSRKIIPAALESTLTTHEVIAAALKIPVAALEIGPVVSSFSVGRGGASSEE